MTTITHKGKTYRIGDGPLEPVPLPDFLPTVLPAGWEDIPVDPRVGREYGRRYAKHGSTRVIISCAVYGDGKRWLHVTLPMPQGRGFLGYACVYDHYVDAQRLRPSRGTFPEDTDVAASNPGTVRLVLSIAFYVLRAGLPSTTPYAEFQRAAHATDVAIAADVS